MKPKIGVPRIYGGSELPVIYPGEMARSQGICMDQLVELILEADASGETDIAAPVAGWIVEPDPSWAGWCRRWRYRLLGQWFRQIWRSDQRLAVNLEPVQEDVEEIDKTEP